MSKSIVAVLFFCFLCVSVTTADVILVDGTQPRATIVIAQESVGATPDPRPQTLHQEQPRSNKVAAAARDLQVYVEKISGAKLPIIGDDQPLPAGDVILVGRSKLTRRYDEKIPRGLTPTRDEEGYAIITDGRRLVLAGNDERPYHGTEYAVAALLHRLGVRWYMPGEFGEVVPKQPTIRVGRIDEVSRPDFKMRNWWGPLAPDLLPVEYRWKIRNGMNPLLRYIALPADSSIRSVLPPEKQKTNEAYAAVFARNLDGSVFPHMPNLTSTASVQFAAEKIKEYFRKHPDVLSYGLGADDGLPRDFSAATQKMNLGFPDLCGRFNDPAGMSATEEWMQWVQRVAAEVYQEFPDHIITSNGYANRNTPPLGIVTDPKIWIMFAGIWSDTYHALDNPRSWMTQRQGRMIQEWCRLYQNVYMYNYIYYNLVGCGAPPIPLAHRHAHDMPLLKRYGVVGFSDEGRCVCGESGVFPTWLRARLMWDTKLNATALMDEFFTNWYGPAAAPAKAFWEEMENAIEQSPWCGNEDHVLNQVYTPALVAKLEAHLTQAEAAAAGNAWAAPRVSADRVTFDHLRAYQAMVRAEFNADFAEAAKQAQRMLDLRQPATELSRFYFDPQPKTGESYGFYYWGAVSRRKYYEKMANLTTNMVAVLSERAKFAVDPRDEGRFDGWFQPDFDDREWKNILTTVPFYGQGPWMDEQGFPYLGALWYRLETKLPASVKGKKVSLYCAAAETEAWVWVNGQFIGHRPYIEAYLRPNAIDLDVTDALLPGKNNVIAIRLHTNYQPAQMAAGLVSRLLLYEPVR